MVGAERPDSLDAAEPTLEDVYFATLQQHGIDVGDLPAIVLYLVAGGIALAGA